MSRLKLAQKKKAALGQKSRREIADYLAVGKYQRTIPMVSLYTSCMNLITGRVLQYYMWIILQHN